MAVTNVEDRFNAETMGNEWHDARNECCPSEKISVWGGSSSHAENRRSIKDKQ